VIWAEPEELDGVTDLGESGLGGDALGPRLDLGPGHLDAAPTDSADDVVVVLALEVGTPAEPELRLAILPMHDVGQAVLHEQCKVSVDGRQAYPVTPLAQLVEELLGGTESVGLAQGVFDGSGLSRAPYPARGAGTCDCLSHGLPPSGA
jgi:hypothetical protein